MLLLCNHYAFTTPHKGQYKGKRLTIGTRHAIFQEGIRIFCTRKKPPTPCRTYVVMPPNLYSPNKAMASDVR